MVAWYEFNEEEEQFYNSTLNDLLRLGEGHIIGDYASITQYVNAKEKEVLDNVVKYSILELALNHCLWYFYNKSYHEIAKVFNDLWEQVRDNFYELEQFNNDKAQNIHFRITD